MVSEMRDAAARETALDVRRSFVVQAPAGSGKTELLVRRFLKLLQVVKKPEEVLAITFTKKAAAEMRKRVLERLPASGEIAHRLRIQTIDAFCTALTRQVPVLARFGAQPEIVEDASELYREAASRVFHGLNSSTEKLLAHLDNNVPQATDLLAKMLESRDRWLRKTGAVPTRAELEATLVSERTRLLDRARALYPSASEELAKQLLTKEGTWRKRDALAQKLSDNEPLREALFPLCSMPPAKYEDRQWEALEAILALLKPAVAQLKVLFGERGQADFTEFAHGALEALGSVDDPSDLLLSLDQKISHILVDEFQDTSQSQFSLLEKLVSGWQPDDGRTLFLVGDPMQSIYRFREAEVSLFLKSKHSGVGSVKLEPIELSTNRRSQEGLVAWFNAAFPRVLPSQEDQTSGAVPYLPASPHEPALPGAAVSWHCFYDREAEARQVVSLVQSSPGKNAILVRNRAHLDEIVPALKEAGVRFKALDIEQLGEKQVVQDLYALTRALLHLGDRIAWLSILRAPWCGLTLADLLLLSSGPPDKGGSEFTSGGFLVFDLLNDVVHLSPDGRARVSRLRSVLKPLIDNRLRGSLRERVEGAWLALGGPACVESETDLEDAEIFLDELERQEEAGEVDLAALEDKIDRRLYAQPDVKAPKDAVEIMTIHRAKGLEFDTVIVPGLDRLPRSGPKPLLAWKSLVGFGPPDKGGTGGLLLAPVDETGAGEDPTYKYVRELDKEADDIESGRLFYVAATRAKQRLHLLACAKATEDLAAKEPSKRSLLSKIWWQAREHFGPAPADAIAEPERMPIRDVLHRLPADFAVPAAPTSVKWSAPEDARDENQVEFSWAGETARHIGTVVHRWLQKVAEDQMRGWAGNRIGSLRKRIQSELLRLGILESDLILASDSVIKALTNSVGDPKGRWLLGPHDSSQVEYRLRAQRGARIRSYVIDLSFRDRDGLRWIVDYKTSRHQGADIDSFIASEQERYAPQLESYANALSDTGQKKLGLYFPMHRRWCEWMFPS
ncbi:MAG: ATP-dependent helicase/nuclease subunit [Betaproteobacteria bacterium]|nr:ATP-dependent helicase/nuclease subunit [Betaproteobacteria bacterium]